MNERVFKRGDVVFANHVIAKSWQDEYDEGLYVAVVYGELGIVELVTEEGDISVNFYKSGEQLVRPEDINIYQGYVARR